MANKTLLINYTIPVGSYLKLGYRQLGSSLDFTYIQPNPFFNQTPYSIQLDELYQYEFELSTICNGKDCNGETSTPVYIQEGMSGITL